MAALDVDNGSVFFLVGCSAFPLVDDCPQMLGIMAGMDQKDCIPPPLVRSSSTLAMAFAGLVLLALHLALFSFLLSPGPKCSASYGRYDPEGLFRALQFWHVQGSFCRYFAPRAVFLPWFSGPDAVSAGPPPRSASWPVWTRWTVTWRDFWQTWCLWFRLQRTVESPHLQSIKVVDISFV